MYRKDLIDELKKEHQILASVLNEVKGLKVTTPPGRAKLNEFKEILLKHLGKEDAELYPPLIEQAKIDFGLQKILDEFNAEMNEISKAFLEFLDKYSNANTSANFIIDFYKIMSVLKKRINREENLLYEVYLKYANQ